MKLFDMVIQEYIAIVQRLEEKAGEIENHRIIIDKEVFKDILGKYPYMKVQKKIQIYKSLGFIKHDNASYTYPVKVKNPETNRSNAVRKVVFDYHVYQTIKELYQTEIH